MRTNPGRRARAISKEPSLPSPKRSTGISGWARITAWFAFDGVRFVPWKPPAGEQLPAGAITRLLVTRDGSLWIATLEGLARWKGGRLTRYSEFAGRAVGRILEDRSGTIWAAVFGVPGGRLCAIQESGVRCYGDDGRFGPWVLSLYEYQGGLWAGALSGLWRWKPDPPQFYAMPGPKPDISDLIEGDNGALWLATRDGIRQWTHGKVVRCRFRQPGRSLR